jgi:hypothetical protein
MPPQKLCAAKTTYIPAMQPNRNKSIFISQPKKLAEAAAKPLALS